MDVSDRKLMLKRITATHKPGYKFPVEKRIEVVTKYLALGNMRLVAEITGVSYQLCRMWKQMPWWKDLEAEIRAAKRVEKDTKLAKIVDKALEQVEDRIENGNIVYNRKTGELIREPVTLKDINKVANDLMTRQIELEKTAVAETSTQQTQTIADQLKMLAEEFAKFNTKRTITINKDVEDAVYEEREEGLQNGEREIQFSSGERSKEGSEESSQIGNGEGGESLEGGWEGRWTQDSTVEGWDELEGEPGSSNSQNQSFFQPQ